MTSLAARAAAAALISLAPMAFLPASAARAAPAPVADFFRAPMVDEAVPSPDGRRIALVAQGSNGRKRLIVVEPARPEGGKVVAGFAEFDIDGVHWVNDSRLVFSVRDTAHALAHPIWPGLWGVDADGGNQRQLILVDNNEPPSTGTSMKSRVLQYYWTFDSTVNDGSPDVIVQRHAFSDRGELMHTTISRLDTQTGVSRALADRGPEHAMSWWTDPKGTPVAAMSRSDTRTALHLAQPDGSWKQVYETAAWTDSVPRPLRLDAQRRLWMVGADPEGKSDATVLMRYALDAPNSSPQVVLALKGYDFQGALVTEHATGEVLGVRYESDAPSTHWFNARMRAIQADIDAQLGDTSNAISCKRCLDAERLLVVARSDRQAPVLMMYTPATKKLELLMASRPWLDAKQMGEREPVSFKARDGRMIPALVTFPPGPRQDKRPAVILVHGGPWVRGTHWADWGGGAEAQFLASRGYVVVEPEFRGSTGYGYEHYAAGFKQWGLTMQDDVSDAMDFAAAKGWIDTERTCIAGASYGGYATLMGLAKEPERYRCGVEWVGVSDIELMYSVHWSDTGDAYKKYGMPLMIGDRVKDAAQLKATSPVAQAARINKPLLMAYGGTDRRVPIDHGKAMRDALQAAGNKQVQWIAYPDEGHGWTRLENNVDFWTRVEAFLARNIGPDARATP